ncbi:MAG: non-homologous end-joining DNA ligase [Nitrospirota bacterium]
MSRERVGFDSRTIELSNLEKVLFPEDGITKADLIDYYDRAAAVMLPFVQGRPLMLERFPDGIYGDTFVQQQAPDYFPEWIARAAVPLKGGGSITHITAENRETLLYLANQVSVPHIWLSRADTPDNPDRMIFDIDPSEDRFGPVRSTALMLREFLREAGLGSFVMTTGSRGLHVVVPLDGRAGFDEVRGFAQGMVGVLIRMEPDMVTAEQRIERREGRVYIDVQRNAFGQTAVAPYAVRALAGAPVAAPLAWNELRDPRLTARAYTLRDLDRLIERKNPWEALLAEACSLEKARRRLKTI